MAYLNFAELDGTPVAAPADVVQARRETGFSVLECIDIEPPELSDYYPEFKRSGCRFLQCLHDKEPGCAVKEQLIKGEISKERYDRYLILLNQLRQRKETMYD